MRVACPPVELGTPMPPLLRKGHFLGAKLRELRKRNGLTLEELSSRCIQRNAERAPSVSYLSMIESGKRVPSSELLELLAEVFQRDPGWFLDESSSAELVALSAPAGGAAKVPLEPAFLFSKDVLQAAIPELLQQTGTSGRQFAHLLIRTHQEFSRNDFPDLERAAEEIGERKFPLSVEDLMRLTRRHGLEIRWFERRALLARDKDREVRSVVRSFFESPRFIYANRALQSDPARLKFDLAAHIAHKVLHGGDGLKSAHATGGGVGGRPRPPRFPGAGGAGRGPFRGAARGGRAGFTGGLADGSFGSWVTDGEVVTSAGGKGVNGAGVMHALGEPVTVLGLFGGYTGDYLLREIAREGLAAEPVAGARRTRTALSRRRLWLTSEGDSPKRSARSCTHTA